MADVWWGTGVGWTCLSTFTTSWRVLLCVLPVYIFIYVYMCGCGLGVCRGQERVPAPLALQLQVAVSYHMWRTKLRSPGRRACSKSLTILQICTISVYLPLSLCPSVPLSLSLCLCMHVSIICLSTYPSIILPIYWMMVEMLLLILKIKSVCLRVCMYVLCVQCFRRPEEGVRCTATVVTDICEPPRGCWELTHVFFKNSTCS